MAMKLGSALVFCLLGGLVLFLVTDSVMWLVAGLAVWLLLSVWTTARKGDSEP